MEETKFDPKELIAETATELVEKDRTHRKSQIRDMFLKLKDLEFRILDSEKKLAKDKKAKDDALNRIEKLKAGDWSVLADIKNDAKKPEENENTN